MSLQTSLLKIFNIITLNRIKLYIEICNQKGTLDSGVYWPFAPCFLNWKTSIQLGCSATSSYRRKHISDRHNHNFFPADSFFVFCVHSPFFTLEMESATSSQYVSYYILDEYLTILENTLNNAIETFSEDESTIQISKKYDFCTNNLFHEFLSILLHVMLNHPVFYLEALQKWKQTTCVFLSFRKGLVLL